MHYSKLIRMIVLLIGIVIFCTCSNQGTILKDVDREIIYPEIVTAQIASSSDSSSRQDLVPGKEQHVSIDSTITIRFSRSMDTRSVKNALSITSESNEKLAPVLKWSGGNKEVTIELIDLTPDTSFVLLITKDAMSDADLMLQEEFRGPFRITEDRVQPVITGTDPANKATEISGKNNIRINFSKPMNKALTEAAFSLRDSNNNAIDGTITWSGNDLVFNPRAPLHPFTDYIISMTEDAADLAGNPLKSPIRNKFTVSGQFVINNILGYGKSSRYFLSGPGDIVTFERNNEHYLFVNNVNKHRIIKYKLNYIEGKDTPSLIFVNEWGTYGSGAGNFQQAGGIAIDQSGILYVTDVGNHRIQKFDFNGEPLGGWGENGNGDGQFVLPVGIAVDNSGDIYVADYANHQIQKFDSEGTPLNKWGKRGGADGEFIAPTDIAVDSLNHIYVTDQYNERIQKFDAGGRFMSKWGTRGSGEGQFERPCGITVDNNDTIYVTDYEKNRVQKFDNSGDFIDMWGQFGVGSSEFIIPTGITTDVFNNIFVADLGNNRIQMFNSAGDYILDMGYSATSSNDGFLAPSDVAVDDAGNIYVVDTGNARIKKFNSDGTDSGISWGRVGEGDGQFRYAKGIAIDNSGDIYIADIYNDRIQIFDTTGKYKAKFTGPHPSRPFKPADLTFDDEGNMYVVDIYINGIRKYDSEKKLLFAKKISGSNAGELNKPIGIALDSNNNIYIVDSGNQRIQKFDNEGNILLEWGRPQADQSGDEPGLFKSPTDIAIDKNDRIYVSDAGKNSIQQFDTEGTLLLAWKSYGYNEKDIGWIEGIAVDNSGNIYIADTGKNIVLIYSAR